MKKVLIAYSSRTGNTKKVAEALCDAADGRAELVECGKAADLGMFDLVFAGYWVDKGEPDKIARQFLRKLENKKIVLFQTLGAEPLSEHALGCFANAGKYISESCSVLGGLSIRGAIDPNLIKAMCNFPEGHPHAPTAENRKRWLDASAHTDQKDLEKASAVMKKYLDMYDKQFVPK